MGDPGHCSSRRRSCGNVSVSSVLEKNDLMVEGSVSSWYGSVTGSTIRSMIRSMIEAESGLGFSCGKVGFNYQSCFIV